MAAPSLLARPAPDAPPGDDDRLPDAPRLVDLHEGEAGPAVVRVGTRDRGGLRDPYHALLTARWPAFLGGVLLAYAAVNVLFALLYLWGEGNIAEARPGSFADAFFFSVQTMATIGYGKMHPQTGFANVLVTVEAMVGTTSLALASALMFARFARPTARLLFSRVAVVGRHEGAPALMFRVANKRHNQLLGADAKVTLVRTEVTAEGEPMVRFRDLRLVRAESPVFALPWTVIHPIDGESPLADQTERSVAADRFEIVVVVSGHDETLSQDVHARHSYLPGDIRWNARFAGTLGRSRGGRLRVDFRRFHQTEPDPETEAEARVGAGARRLAGGPGPARRGDHRPGETGR